MIPKIEVDLKSRKITASGKEAIDVVRWPLRIAIILTALVPIAWLLLLSSVRKLL